MHPSALPIHPHAGIPVKPKNLDLKPFPWQIYFQELFYLQDGTTVFRAGSEGPVICCIHGAGHSALSFATFAKQASQFATVLAFDYRGHGMSRRPNEPFDMSISTLVQECEESLHALMQKYPNQNFILLGHSLGGAIATRIAEKINPEEGGRLVGLVVIDVVEGTALEALPFMMKILEKRPKQFPHVQEAISWALSSRTLMNKDSARVSMQGQLRPEKNTDGVDVFVWKVRLQDSEVFWKDWFQGLSDSFLNVRVAKILFTAEKERLDSKLIVAQMQGKFRLTVIRNVGHSVQEDDPQATAHAVYDFMKIFKIPPTPDESKKKLLQGLSKYKPPFKPY